MSDKKDDTILADLLRRILDTDSGIHISLSQTHLTIDGEIQISTTEHEALQLVRPVEAEHPISTKWTQITDTTPLTAGCTVRLRLPGGRAENRLLSRMYVTNDREGWWLDDGNWISRTDLETYGSVIRIGRR